LAQQTARFLIKCYNKSGKDKLGDFAKYLQETSSIISTKFAAKTSEKLLDTNVQIQAHKWLALYLISRTNLRMKQERSQGKTQSQVWNECMVDLVACAKAHCYYYALHCFVEAIRKCQDEAVQKVLKKLCDLFALYNIEQNLRSYLQGGHISSKQADAICDMVRHLCKEIRKEAIPLVDAFNLPDFLLRTPLGRADGNIYEHYFEFVKKAPENATKVPPYYDTLIKPLLTKQS